jgi:hypothetical protein
VAEIAIKSKQRQVIVKTRLRDQAIREARLQFCANVARAKYAGPLPISRTHLQERQPHDGLSILDRETRVAEHLGNDRRWNIQVAVDERISDDSGIAVIDP